MEQKNKVITGVVISVASTLAITGITAGIAKLSKVSDSVKEHLNNNSSIESSYDGSLDVDCEHVRVVVQGKPATCTEDGLSEGRTCILCGEVLEKQKVIPAFGHDWSETETFVEATCTTDGTAMCKCDTCGVTDTVSLPALGHVERITVEAVAPTCTTKGMTERISCWRCDVILQNETSIPKISHIDENLNLSCDVCDYFFVSDESASLLSNYDTMSVVENEVLNSHIFKISLDLSCYFDGSKGEGWIMDSYNFSLGFSLPIVGEGTYNFTESFNSTESNPYYKVVPYGLVFEVSEYGSPVSFSIYSSTYSYPVYSYIVFHADTQTVDIYFKLDYDYLDYLLREHEYVEYDGYILFDSMIFEGMSGLEILNGTIVQVIIPE